LFFFFSGKITEYFYVVCLLVWWDPQMGASVNYNSNTTPSASNSFQLGPSVFVVLVALFAVLINQLTEV
jgi:hypothetical protein